MSSSAKSAVETRCDEPGTTESSQLAVWLCQWCGGPYEPTKPGSKVKQRFCCTKCRSASWNASHPRIAIGVKLQKDDPTPTPEQLASAGFKVPKAGKRAGSVFLACYLASGCAANPIAPTETFPSPSVEVRHDAQGGESLPDLLDPYSLTTYTWSDSQYDPTIRVHNPSDRELFYTLAVWETFYPTWHPRFFETQEAFFFIRITVPAGLTTTYRPKVPEGCDVTYQLDIHPGIAVEDVLSGKVDLHPSAVPKIQEASFKFGKSRAACEKPVPVPPPAPPLPVPPPPVPPPPVVMPCSRDFCPPQ